MHEWRLVLEYSSCLPSEPGPVWTRPTDEGTRSQTTEKKKQIQASNRKSRQTKRNRNHYKVVLDKRAIHGLFVRIYGCTPMAPQRTYGYLTAFAVTSVNRSGLRNGMLGGGMACVRNYGPRPRLATNSTPPFHEKLSYHGTRRCDPATGSPLTLAQVVKMLADMLGLDAVAVCPTPRSHSSGT